MFTWTSTWTPPASLPSAPLPIWMLLSLDTRLRLALPPRVRVTGGTAAQCPAALLEVRHIQRHLCGCAAR